MTLHLLKHCVGAKSIEDLQSWQNQQLALREKLKQPLELMHVTRQTPRRSGFQAGSSLYWIIQGFIRVRQVIQEIRDVECDDGISRCGLVFDPQLIATKPQPRRPFQGWRYLTEAEAPPDEDFSRLPLDSGLSPSMQADLMELRLI